MWDVAIRGRPFSDRMSEPSMNLYPPIISLSSGFQTIIWRQGGCIVSKASMSQSRPVPPPASRKEISRRRPISLIVLGALKASTTYISFPPLLVLRRKRSGVSSATIRSGSTLSMIFCIVTTGIETVGESTGLRPEFGTLAQNY